MGYGVEGVGALAPVHVGKLGGHRPGLVAVISRGHWRD